ncbi:Spermatogenesis-associated protein 5 [Nymphon striatum]|nr:Spermatogenesis-associated protein 5 [Nymphon striatum]
MVFNSISAEMAKKLPVHGRNRTVLLHPLAMHLSNISIGDKVILEVPGENQRILTAWLSTSIGADASGSHPTTIKLISCDSKKYDYSCGFISIYKLPHVPASKVVLRPDCKHDYHDTDGFKSHLLHENEATYLNHKSKIQCKYFGKICKFVVNEIIGENGTILTRESVGHNVTSDFLETVDGSRDELCTSIESINLSSLSLNDADVTSSTPKRILPSVSSEKLNYSTSMKKINLGSFRLDFEEIIYFYLTINSKIHITDDSSISKVSSEIFNVKFEDIGAVKTQIDTIKNIFKAGFKLSKNILLHGPAGTGKTMICEAIATEMNFHFITVNGPGIYSKNFGESEENLRNIFREAVSQAPSVIFLDEIDALCPKYSETDLEKRVISTLTTLIDEVGNSGDSIIVIAATNRPDSLDSSLRRSGRLDKEIEIGVPDAPGRHEILTKILNKVQHNLSDNEIKTVAEKCHGYTGADLNAVCSEARRHTLELTIKNSKRLVSDNELSSQVMLTLDDIKYALRLVKPSVMREIRLEISKVFWNDIGGLEGLKLKLKQAVEWPIKYPEAFRRLNMQPPNGVLMYGPPGCSKTMIAKALATESGLNFFSIKGPELFGKWVGESERAVREVFRKARAASPAIIFFDEIDALASERGSSSGSSGVGDRVLTQLLTEMDGVEFLENVVVVAATNRPDMIDEALMRPGRFDRKVYVPLPDLKAREQIFKIHFKKTPVDSDVLASALAEKTDGYSGAEIVALIQEACLLAMENDINVEVVQLQFFNQVLQTFKPRIKPELIKYYEDYQNSKHNM